MPPWPHRYPSDYHNGTASNVSSDHIDTSRALPPLPPSTIDLEIPTLYPRRRAEAESSSAKHGRSFSHPFPSFFGGGSKRSEKRNHLKQKINTDSTDDEEPNGEKRSNGSSKLPSRNLSASTNNEPMTGRCMACDSTVRWPRALKVFRCTICLTVNDLEPYQEATHQFQGANHNNGHPFPGIPRKALSLSLERTKAMLEHCLHVYLSARLEEVALKDNDNQLSTLRPIPERAPRGHAYEFRARLDGRGTPNPKLHHLYPNAEQSLQLDEPGKKRSPTLSGVHLELPHRNDIVAEPSDLSDQEGSSRARNLRAAIFRPVENYVASCFAGCATLNTSFLSVRPEFQRAASEGQSTRSGPKKSSLSQPGNEGVLSAVEVDAKTLLLGDIAENSSWWTGEKPSCVQSTHVHGRERSPDSWRGVVSIRSPRINWTEAASWYRALLEAGDSWQEKWRNMQAEASLRPSEPGKEDKGYLDFVDEMESDIVDSRNHLQKALFKATENLLKRPRRPLKHAEDCRFLFVLLANPLLYSSDSSPVLRRPKVHSPGQRSGPGQHSGVIKRILGLMAHLPNEVHQCLVSWFSRFSDNQFQRVVDLIGGFVTYRLSRPPPKREMINPTEGLVPSFSDSGNQHASQLHAAIGGSRARSTSSRTSDSTGKPQLSNYGEDWQICAAARVMALLFTANGLHPWKRREAMPDVPKWHSSGLTARHSAHAHGQLIPISNFYNTMLDYADLAADFENWESNRGKFSFCQYPFFLSIYAKIHLMEMEARRQMEIKAREAFFDSILSNKAVSQFLVLKVRRDCLVDDSLRRISEAVGSGQGDIKKGLKIDFIGEEGVDAGGLRKEWFLLLIREVFDEAHGLFVYDEDSRFCYFNPHCFESSEQYFLVGVVTGLAIYNSTILDIAVPPFVFKKLLTSTPATNSVTISTPRLAPGHSLEDLAELRPTLARGLRLLLEYDGNVQETFCRDFVVEDDRYGEMLQTPLCAGGDKIAVTNSNRREFVELYIHHLLDTSVSRQYEPFKRGFFTVCGGNALSLFRPEEIELLIRGSDEPLDINSLRAVAVYEGWPSGAAPDQQPQVLWFWEAFERAEPVDQRKLLTFITGSDRIPAMGAANLIIKVQLLSDIGKKLGLAHADRFPTARTCFNTLVLHLYRSREQLEQKLWMAVSESEGFGLK